VFAKPIVVGGLGGVPSASIEEGSHADVGVDWLLDKEVYNHFFLGTAS
jgi:hypothetical protein